VGFDLTKQRFYEPFMGGGAVTWALADDPAAKGLKPPKGKAGRPLILNDVNTDLVNVYQVVQTRAEELITRLAALEGDTGETAYYKARDTEPTDPLERAARMVFLNKLSFNGLHRVRGDGKFNVPYGQSAKSSIHNAVTLRACSDWLTFAEIRSGDFASALADVRAGDVVYLDPPYIPLSATASFSRYTKVDFGVLNQWALAGVIRGLVARGALVMLSNSNTELTREIFGRDLNLYAVSAQRSVGAASASRTKVEEVVGISYSPATVRNPATLKGLRRLTTVRKPR
jgi:DNA adenine methylase